MWCKKNKNISSPSTGLDTCIFLAPAHASPGKKSAHAKTQWQADTLSFSSKPVKNGTNSKSSDFKWMDDKDDESDTDELCI